MTGRLSKGLQAVWLGQPLRVPASEVVTIYRANERAAAAPKE
jgi:hypothetical protein